MAGGKKRKGAKAGRTDSKKQRQDDQSADEEKQIELPSPISRLYRDALQSVFKFCGLDDLSRVVRVSCGWLETVRVMPSICAPVTRRPVPCSAIVASALASHVGEIGYAQLTCDALFILKSLPSLTSLTGVVAMLRDVPLCFAQSLQTIDLGFQGDEAKWPAINAAIVTISRLPLVTALSLSIPSYSAKLSFAPLSAASKLTSLNMAPPDPTKKRDLTAEQIDQFRALPWLHKLVIVPISKTSFAKLHRAPHQLQWQQVGCPDGVGPEEAALLTSLPLTKLTAWSCNDLSFLAPLSSLLRDLRLFGVGSALSADDLVAAVSRCTQLTSLALSAQVTSAQLSRLMASLPELTEITLTGCNELKSLRCFSACKSIQDTLHQLTISHCDAMASSEIKHLLSLRHLTSLRLTSSFDGPLDDCSIALLTPPTLALPSLEFFHYVFSANSPEPPEIEGWDAPELQFLMEHPEPAEIE